MNPVLLAVETTIVVAAPGAPIALNVESALGLSASSRLSQYRLRLVRWGARRTAGAAAISWSPMVSEDAAGADPLLVVDQLGVGLAITTFVRTPPAPVLFIAPNGVFSVVLAPNAGGDTFRVRAVVELVQ